MNKLFEFLEKYLMGPMGKSLLGVLFVRLLLLGWPAFPLQS